MDSVTQAALGASIAHLFWHKNFGKKAFAFGAVIGTIPDLDIIIYPFLNGVQRLYWHRGESHSIFFVFLASFFLYKLFLNKARECNLSDFKFFTGLFLIFATHIAIDIFTVYGTQILSPFNRYGFAIGNLYIVDPMYTIPLLAGIFAGIAFNAKKGFKANCAGLFMSSVYVLFSLSALRYADLTFKKNLESKNIKVLNSITSATPMNTILWRHIARTDKGLFIGYFSILGNNPKNKIRFDFVPRNEELIKSIENQNNIKAINWFSKGFWTAEIKNGTLTMSDLRFGEFRPYDKAPSNEWVYIFTWEITKNTNELKTVTKKNINYKKAVRDLFSKIKDL
jgi:inner membrane protein